MGLISKAKEAIRESAERRAAEQQALQERMRPYMRGYDVFPDEVCGYFVGKLRGRIGRRLIIKLLFFFASAGGAAAAFYYEVYAGFMIGLLAAIVLFIFTLGDIISMSYITRRRYDAFGGMVTNTHVEAHYHTDSEGRDTTTYEYFVWLNGVECRVSGGEFNRISVGVYCYFIRIKAKYIKNDRFYFFPTDPAEQDHRIGQHYPADELRLYSAPPAGAAANLILALGILSAIGCMIAWYATDDGKNTELPIWPWAALGGVGVIIIGIIARGISRSIRARRIVEEKRRSRQQLL